MRPQPLDVRHETIGRVDRQVGIGLADQRAAAPAAALVEQHGPVHGRVEVASRAGRAAAARAAVQPDSRQALRGADRLPVQGLAVTNLELAEVVRLDGFVQIIHTLSSPWAWADAELSATLGHVDEDFSDCAVLDGLVGVCCVC